MGLVATSSDGNNLYPQIPAGVHSARCIKVIDLGTQRNEWEGQISWRKQVMIVWEVPGELHNDEPMTISKFYTLSLHEKSNLGADSTSWRGRAFTETEKQGFDISNLAGVPCMLNVVEGNNGKARISTIMPLAKGDEMAGQYNETVIFSLNEYQEGNIESFNKLSDGIRRMVLRCKELEGNDIDMGDGNNGADIGSDDVPF